MIRCGMSEVQMTPPLGNSIPGYFTPRISTGVKDELFVKAMVIESGDQIFALASIDCLDLSQDLVSQIRKQVHEQIKIPTSSIMIAATHTHTGPTIRKGFTAGVNETYLIKLIDLTVKSIVEAFESRKIAKVGFARGHESSIAFQRRFYMKDGQVRTNPGVGNPDIDRPAGPIDPEVLVMRIDDASGRPIGVITNYACHTDCVGGTEYSGDYPSILSQRLKEQLGSQAVSMFLMGTSGNINHIDVSGKEPRDATIYQRMGTKLAEEVMQVYKTIELDSNLPIRQQISTFTVQHRSPNEDELNLVKRVENGEVDDAVEKIFAAHVKLILQDESEKQHSNIELQVLEVGELAILGLPGELFVEYGLQIKKDANKQYLMISTLTNGSANGYICTVEAYEQGGYEPRITNSSKLEIDTGEKIVEHSLKILN